MLKIVALKIQMCSPQDLATAFKMFIPLTLKFVCT